MATKPVAKYPMIIRTTSEDDLPYADDDAAVELVPLATEADTANLLLDAQKLFLPRRSSTRSVKNRRGSSPDMKFIEDESDSELVALAGIDSRQESSSVPRGDNLPEYDVEELKNLLLSSPSTGWIRTQPPSDSHPAKKESLTDDKTDPIVVNILNHSPSPKGKSRHEYEKLTKIFYRQIEWEALIYQTGVRRQRMHHRREEELTEKEKDFLAGGCTLTSLWSTRKKKNRS